MDDLTREEVERCEQVEDEYWMRRKEEIENHGVCCLCDKEAMLNADSACSLCAECT
jgi:hypothetical protein